MSTVWPGPPREDRATDDRALELPVVETVAGNSGLLAERVKRIGW